MNEKPIELTPWQAREIQKVLYQLGEYPLAILLEPAK